MILEVAAVFIESVSVATSILGESKRRRNSQSAGGILTALSSIDFDTVLESATHSPRLAAAMRGAMTDELCQLVIRDPQVSRIMTEMVLASVVEDQDTAISSISSLLVARTKSILSGKVAVEDAEYFAHHLVAITRDFCSKIVAAALAEAPDSVIKIQQLATMKRTHAILQRVSEQLDAANRNAMDGLASQRRAFINEYRAVCAEVHGSIKPPDFETNQRIPIEDLYVAPVVRPEGQDNKQEPLDPLEFAKLVDRTVLLGDPGGGKSTLSNYLTTVWARDPDGPIPFHVTLREFALESESLSVVQYIEALLPSGYQLQRVDGAVEDILVSGNAVVVFDGLDELTDPTKRRAMTTAVETFAFRYPMVRIFVTSRRVGYEQAQLDPANFDAFLIDGFDRSDVEEYVQKWFASQSAYTEAQAGKRALQFISQSKPVEELSSNPLMLSLMCIIFRGENFIPRNRPAIYEKCANLLFEKWDGHRQIEVPLKARDHVDAAMKHVAYVFLESGSGDTGIRREALVQEMTTYLFPRAMQTEEKARSAAEEFVDFCAGRAWVFSDAGSTADGEPIFTFTHRTFMEYFAAVHLIRVTDTPENLGRFLLPRIAREEWDVVAQLAVQQLDKATDQGTERALSYMLSDNRRRTPANRAHVLNFVVRCSEFAVVSPAFIARLAAVCLEFFADFDDPEESWYNEGLAPLLSLQDFVSLDQTPVAIDAVRKRLFELLSDPSGSRFRSAVFFGLLGLLRRFNGRLWKGDPRSDLWDECFLSIATDERDVFQAVVASDPESWVTLILGGAVSPAIGIGKMRDAGLSFHEIYFTNGLLQPSGISDSSLAVSISSGLYGRDLSELRNREIYEEGASVFLADFVASDRSRALGFAETASELRPLYPTPRSSEEVSQPTAIVDFLMIVAMSLDEMNFSQRQRSFDVAIIDQLGLSPDVERFAARWHEGTESIFDREEPSNA
jgi:hypothetical protein